MAARADKILIIRDGKLVEEKIKDRATFDFRAAKEIYRENSEPKVTQEQKISKKKQTRKTSKKSKKDSAAKK
jgi:hypothetical protein